MPTLVKSYIDQLKGLKSKAVPQAERIVLKLQDQIADYVREKQLFDKGIDGKGKFLGHYSSYTIALKKAKGEVYNRTTLLDTEDFYKGFFVTGRNKKIEIFSTDKKTKKLIDKYGKDIFLLTVENNKLVNDNLILPILIEWLINEIKV
ncbi:MAG: hypothetical protein ACI9DK_003031 [Vicingaceae bacterium]|jgi:hypothetical protein